MVMSRVLPGRISAGAAAEAVPDERAAGEAFTENERLEAPAFRHEEEKPLSFVSKIRTCYTPQYMV